jgi:primosomal protein N' (replication factor Y)
MPETGASSEPLSAARAGLARVRVLLPLALDHPYDYAVPAGTAAAPGDFVMVPLGRRERIGCVWDGAGEEIDSARLKNIGRVLPAHPLAEKLRRFVEWVARYNCAALGAVLKMVTSAPGALEPERPVTGYVKSGAEPPAKFKLTDARRRVLAAADGPPRAAAELAREAGVSAGVVSGLVEAGMLKPVPVSAAPRFGMPDAYAPGPVLSPEQRACADELSALVRDGYSVTLLDGVTGSGKTEVYLTAVAAALAAGKQVLVLVPEIALTAQWLARFEQRFGAAPAPWHSDLTDSQRRHCWRAVAEGSARVIVGARSALFLPFRELGLVVVDEEHDASFKQEEGVTYQARDMAVVRAYIENIPIVLVSATPSLETYVNVEHGRYRRLHLPDRFAGAKMPEIALIDIRADRPPRQAWLSPTLRAQLAETLAAGEQALLFLNRRGFAPLTLCRNCGNRLQCPNCTAWLVEHRREGRLRCHHCGYAAARPETCPACGEEDSFAACGPGVERLADEVAALHPKARIGIMTSDTLRGPDAASDFIARIENREFDVIIGTQVVAKGHHFPYLTLVGVIDGDLGLAGGDLRAAERTYQLLSQVSGRAGRAAHPGRVFIQTVMPDSRVMQALASGAREEFYRSEADSRRSAAMPPFGRLAAVIVSGEDEAEVIAAARALARSAPSEPGIAVLGPAAAPLRRIASQYRWRLLMKTAKEVNIQAAIRDWLPKVKVKSGVRVKADIDPYSFM